jgi:Arc/MetJ family transcription regulator
MLNATPNLELHMRTRIDIDSALMDDVLKLSGLPTREAAVEQTLRIMSERLRAGQAIDALRNIGWEGDLSGMREGRNFHDPQ